VLAAVTASGAAAHGNGQPKPTIVRVHGALADSSSWNSTVARLQHDRYPMIAAANPLRGLASDAAYVSALPHAVTGPVVLVGHSYGGSVITNAARGTPGSPVRRGMRSLRVAPISRDIVIRALDSWFRRPTLRSSCAKYGDRQEPTIGLTPIALRGQIGPPAVQHRTAETRGKSSWWVLCCVLPCGGARARSQSSYRSWHLCLYPRPGRLDGPTRWTSRKHRRPQPVPGR
jgi:pimeloyl-ACP methyl ester carboxylesterase